MSARTLARRVHRRHARFDRLTPPQKQAEAARQLVGWRQEAFRRAQHLTAPCVWALAYDPGRRALALVLDPSRGLLEDLEHACAEAIASQAGRHLVSGSRPLADRGRLCRPRPLVPAALIRTGSRN